MNWFVGFTLLGISWGSVIMLDVAFRNRRFSIRIQSVGKSILGTFTKSLCIYELLWIVTVVMVQVYVSETVGPTPLNLYPFAALMYGGSLIGVYYGVSRRADKPAMYRRVVREMLTKVKDPEASILQFISIYSETPGDEENAALYQALAEISEESTPLGLKIRKVLFEQDRQTGFS